MIRPLHEGISVPDMEASVRWYGDMLGFEPVSDEFVPFLNARIVFLQLGDFQLELFQYMGQDAQPLPPERRHPNDDLKTCGVKHVAFSVEDIRGFIDGLEKKGADIVMPVFPMGESLVCFVRDNSGALLEFIQN